MSDKQVIKQYNNLSLEDTGRLGKAIAHILKVGDIVTLQGDLGVGKTALCREIIRSLVGGDCEVTSPTFSIVQLYDAPQCMIWHVDLYRVEHEEELEPLGLEDAFDTGIALIEWPQIAEKMIPQDRLDITMSFVDNDARCVIMSGHGEFANVINSIDIS